MFIFKFINPRLVNHANPLCVVLSGCRKSIVRHLTVRRTMLLVPGHEKRKIDKAFSMKIDCLAFDLDNVVCDSDKEEARKTVTKLLDEGLVTKADPEWCVRINSIQLGNIFQMDMDSILSARSLPAAIALPGVDCCDHLQIFTEHLWRKLMERPEDSRGPVELLLVIGSPKAFLHLTEICQKAQDLATMAPVVPSALIFDSDSFVEKLGVRKTSHGLEFLYAREKLVLTAKAFGMQAIDIVCRNPVVNAEFENECKEGEALGYTGKQLIFPSHIGVAQHEFTPKRTRINDAKALLKRHNQMEREKEKSKLERLPIDPAPMKVAEYAIEAAKLAGKISDDNIRKALET